MISIGNFTMRSLHLTLTSRDKLRRKSWRQRYLRLRLYDPDSIVPTDDSLLDDVFEAGMTLLLDAGFFCADTNRIIEFNEDEVKDALRSAYIIKK